VKAARRRIGVQIVPSAITSQKHGANDTVGRCGLGRRGCSQEDTGAEGTSKKCQTQNQVSEFCFHKPPEIPAGVFALWFRKSTIGHSAKHSQRCFLPSRRLRRNARQE